MPRAAGLAAGLLALGLASCDKGTRLEVAPRQASLPPGGSQQFTVLVTRSASTNVRWRVASGGLEGSAPRDGASKVCSSVFHCSQLGHCPDQRAKRAPQAWHWKDERLLAIASHLPTENSPATGYPRWAEP